MHVNLPEKLYYSIGEIANAFSVNTSLDALENAAKVEADLDAKIQRIIKEMKLN